LSRVSPRFSEGSVAYAKDGRRYVVEEVAGGLVYCTSDGGAEAEFGESQLMTESEWAARTGGKREMLYVRLRQARAFGPAKGVIDRGGAEQALARAERLFPGLLDFTAFTAASRALSESGDESFIPELSIIKCRAIFDAASPETRATLLSGIIGAPAEKMVSASKLGDNMARAMIEKGLDTARFEAFGARRRQ
jgi:hypothetical protein